jgi:hypothetical protein
MIIIGTPISASITVKQKKKPMTISTTPAMTVTLLPPAYMDSLCFHLGQREAIL